jgi:hypothetical protein
VFVKSTSAWVENMVQATTILYSALAATGLVCKSKEYNKELPEKARSKRGVKAAILSVPVTM